VHGDTFGGTVGGTFALRGSRRGCVPKRSGMETLINVLGKRLLAPNKRRRRPLILTTTPPLAFTWLSLISGSEIISTCV
jgi:hypothetical protein